MAVNDEALEALERYINRRDFEDLKIVRRALEQRQVPDLWLLDTSDGVGRDWTDEREIGEQYNGIPVKLLTAAPDPGERE